MTPTTAAMATAVVTADMSIRSRTRASVGARLRRAIGRGFVGSLLSDFWSMAVTVTQTSVLVAAEEAGERLDRVLARHFGDRPPRCRGHGSRR